MKKLENNLVTLTTYQLIIMGLKFKFKFFFFRLRNFRQDILQSDDVWLKF